MKKIFALLTTCVLIAFVVKAANKDAVLGTWLVEDKDAKVELYLNSKGELEGKVVWLLDPNDETGKPRKDVKNKDESLRTRPVMGMKAVYGFKWNAETGEWVDGKVYTAKEGKLYCGVLKLNTNGTLYLRGYICGVKFLGKTNTWTRVK
jgi:uncharacterized protein (DUF2147 family)